MTNYIKSLIALAGIITLTAGIGIGSTWEREGHNLDIPRCASDDFNSTALPMCYTITVDGKVIVLDVTDEIIS